MKIKPGPASKRSSVHAYQATFLAKAIFRLEEAFARNFVSAPDMTQEDFSKFRGLEEYMGFMEAAIVCGFVCDDFTKEFPVDSAHSRPNVVLANVPFQKLRLYVHTLQRTEKWNSQYSTALFDAVKTGALSIVARRLSSDSSIHETDENTIEEEIDLDA